MSRFFSFAALIVGSAVASLLYGQQPTILLPPSAPGKISLFDGVNPIGTARVNGSSNIQVPVAGLTPGSHRIRAVAWATGELLAATEIVIPSRNASALSTASAYPSGIAPKIAVAAPLSTGGLPDLIVAGEGKLSILHNDGNGGFGPPEIRDGIANPVGLVVADFDGSGSPEIAVVGGDGTLAIWRNGIAAKSNLGFRAAGIAVADFNGDGIPDLAFTDPDNNLVRLFAGKGDGTFTAGASFSTGRSPRAIVAGDFNSDGFADFAVVDFGSNDVSIVLGDGKGGFSSPRVYPSGNGPASIVIVGADLVVWNSLDGTGSVLHQNGDGGFEAGTPVASAQAIGSDGASLGIATRDSQVLLGQFTASAGPSPIAVLVADLNGDGASDIAEVDANGVVSVALSVLAAEGAALDGGGTSSNRPGDNATGASPNVVRPHADIGTTPQTITFPALGNFALNYSLPLNMIATASSGLQVTFTSTTPGVCTAGTFVSLVAVGTCSITASQAGDPTTYAPAAPVTQSFSVVKSAQSFSPGIPIAVAGNGTAGYTGDGGPATNAQVDRPAGVAVDSAGNLYMADNVANAIRKVTAATGIISTIAGVPEVSGYSGDGGAATAARLAAPNAVAIDATGNIYIADTGNNVIRKVAAGTGIITTVAGSSSNGPEDGDGGPATSAILSSPYGVAVDAGGNIYIADTGNNLIRKVTAATGIITTVAGSFVPGAGNGDGGPATSAHLISPMGVAVGSEGNIYIADNVHNSVREVTAATGVISTVASGLNSPGGVAVDASGNVYIADSGNSCIRMVTALTESVSALACNGAITFPIGVAVSSTGNVYIGQSLVVLALYPLDLYTQNVVMQTIQVGSSGTLAIFGGSGAGVVTYSVTSGSASCSTTTLTVATATVTGTAAGSCTIVASKATDQNFQAAISQPLTLTVTQVSQRITFGALSNVALNSGPVLLTATADSGLTVTYASTTQSICTVNGNSVTLVAPGLCSITASQAGNVMYSVATPVGQSFTVLALQTISFGALSNTALGSGTVTLTATASSGLAVSFSSTTTGVCTVSGNTATPIANGTCSIDADQGGNSVYAAAPTVTQSFLVAQAQSIVPSTSGIATLAGPAPFGKVQSVATDTSGNVYVADYNNQQIYKITPSGTTSVIAGTGATGSSGDGGPAILATFNNPYRVAVDSSGNIFVADFNNHKIRKIAANTGIISTVAGTGTGGYNGDNMAATTAELNHPTGVAVDASGNLYIAEYDGHRVREVINGTISTIAGTGVPGYNVVFGAHAAQLNHPVAVALDPLGDIYIADSANQRIREIFETPELQGSISTVAGNGTQGFGGDNGAATSAELNIPWDIAFDPAGNMFIADNGNNRIRRVTSGTITTVAGGTAGFAGDGGAVTGAELSGPNGVALGSLGSVLYIADTGNNRVRAVYPLLLSISNAVVTGGTANLSVTGGSGTGTVSYAVTSGNSNCSVDAVSGVVTGTALGTCVVVATKAGDSTYLAAGSEPLTLTVYERLQTISFTTLSNAAVGGGPVILTASASSGLTVTFSSTTQSVCTVSGNSVTLLASGTCTIVANQAGNTIYAPATVIQSFQIGLAQIIVPGTGGIASVAGNGTKGFSGDGAAATSATLSTPSGLAVDSAGNIYIADFFNNRIRKVTVATGIISTVAGNGIDNYSGDGGAATIAAISGPTAVAVDNAGNIYIPDSNFQRIRKVTAATGIITTVAGNGTAGYSGDGMAATHAEINDPFGIAVDGQGNLYIADSANNRIRKVTAATGTITTVAGNGTPGFSGDGQAATGAELDSPTAVAVDNAGNIYIADSVNNRVRMVTASTGIISTVAGNGTASYSGDGLAATSAELNSPDELAVDSAGNVYIADEYSRVRRITVSTGIINTVAGNGTPGYSGDGGAPTNAEINGPNGLAIDASGNLYISDANNQVVRGVYPLLLSSTSQMLAVGGSATLSATGGSNSGAIVYSSLSSSTCIITGSGNTVTGIASGNCVVVASRAGDQTYLPASSEPLTIIVQGPQTIAFAPSSVLFGSAPVNLTATASSGLAVTFASTPADTGICTLSGNTVTIAAAGTCTITAQQAGNAYYTPAQQSANLTILPGPQPIIAGADSVTPVAGTAPAGFSGDGASAVLAKLSQPTGVALDSAGNIYIADTANNRIRMVTAATGIISTVAGDGTVGSSGDGAAATNAELSGPRGVAVDGSGNIYIADTDNNRVRMVAAVSGNISTVAGDGTHGFSGDGSTAINAELGSPRGVAVDSQGNLYIAEFDNNRIRLVTASTGNISTLAGNGPGFSGDGGPAGSALLTTPTAVTLDSAENLYIADNGNHRIRMVAASTGIISTVAGDGDNADGGDGGAATAAGIGTPTGVAVDLVGNIYIADNGHNHLRQVTATSGIINTVALGPNYGVAVDGMGNVYTSDGSFRVRGVFPLSLTSVSQSIAFGASTTLSTTGGSSNGVVSYSVTYGNPNCSINGNTVTGTGAGTCTVTATMAGNQNYLAAKSQPLIITVTQASQTISFSGPGNVVYGSGPVTLTATATSSLGVTFSPTAADAGICTVSGNSVTLAGAGTCAIKANQAGNANYAAAPQVTQSFNITQASQTITVTTAPPSTAPYDSSFPVAATASSGLPVAITASGACSGSGSGLATVTVTSVTGTCTVNLTQAGNTNYAAATSVPFQVSPSIVCVSNLAGLGKAGGRSGGPVVTLVWSGIGQASAYQIQRSSSASGPFISLGSPTSGLSFVDQTSGLVNGGTYYYNLEPLNASGGALCISNVAAIPIP